MKKASKDASNTPSTDSYNKFTQSLELLDVGIQAERCVVFVAPTQVDPAASNIKLEFEYDWLLDKECSSFVVLITGEFSSLGIDNKTIEAELKATYVFTYKVSATEMMADDTLFDLFARVNSTFQAVPYFREFFQSTLARFRLPTFLLPMLKPGFAIEAKRSRKS